MASTTSTTTTRKATPQEMAAPLLKAASTALGDKAKALTVTKDGTVQAKGKKAELAPLADLLGKAGLKVEQGRGTLRVLPGDRTAKKPGTSGDTRTAADKLAAADQQIRQQVKNGPPKQAAAKPAQQRPALTEDQQQHQVRLNKMLADSGYNDQALPRHMRAWAAWDLPADSHTPKGKPAAWVLAWAKGTRPTGDQAKALMTHMKEQQAKHSTGAFSVWARPYCAFLATRKG